LRLQSVWFEHELLVSEFQNRLGKLINAPEFGSRRHTMVMTNIIRKPKVPKITPRILTKKRKLQKKLRKN